MGSDILTRTFGGRKYSFRRWYKGKAEAGWEADKLRRRGYDVRVVAGSSHYKPFYGEQGWRIYKRRSQARR